MKYTLTIDGKDIIECNFSAMQEFSYDKTDIDFIIMTMKHELEQLEKET